MLSLECIQSESRKAERKAAREHKRPYIVTEDQLARWQAGEFRGFPFPYTGGHTPRGYKKTEEYFVDSSGFGAPGELALTVREFISKIKPGYAYALSEVGQFQVYVQEYRPPATARGSFTGADLK